MMAGPMTDAASSSSAPSSVFPSGEWSGYWIQGGERGSQDLRLHFARGRISGAGADKVGEFAIRGGYDDEKREVWFEKNYLGLHSVFYRGFNDGIEGIWGDWQIGAFTRGGFHIWPQGHETGEQVEVSAEEPVLIGF